MVNSHLASLCPVPSFKCLTHIALLLISEEQPRAKAVAYVVWRQSLLGHPKIAAQEEVLHMQTLPFNLAAMASGSSIIHDKV